MSAKAQRAIAAKKEFECRLCVAFKRVMGSHPIQTPNGNVAPEVQMVDTSINWLTEPRDVVGICRGCTQLLQGWQNYQAALAQQKGQLSRIIVPRPGEGIIPR